MIAEAAALTAESTSARRVPAAATATVAQERSRSLERVGSRCVPLAITAAVHVVMILALTKALVHERSIQLPAPLAVRLIEEKPPADVPPPLPTVAISTPLIDMPPPSAVAITELTEAPRSITVAPAVQPTTPAPITLPRFDADYLSNPAPVYPAVSRRLREQGLVLLRVRVTADGRTAQVLIERTSGSPRLDRAAAEAVERWRFVPARRGPESIEAWVLVPIEFELKA